MAREAGYTLGQLSLVTVTLGSLPELARQCGMDLFRVFYLQCARRLPGLPESHPCARLHGHSFTVKIILRGPLDPKLSWVMDFDAVDAAWQFVHARLDHRYLNDIAGLENPTSENLAIWLWQALQTSLPQLFTISVMEGRDAGCIYYGPTHNI